MLRSKSGHTELSQGEVLVGRSRSCQVVLRDPSVSRSHALIMVQGGSLTLRDLASSNGTFINGEKVEGEEELESGDELTFGETQLSLAILDREEAFSFAGLIEEVEFETAEARSFNPILETLEPGSVSASDAAVDVRTLGDAPKLEIGEPLEEDKPLPELPLDEALEELDALFPETDDDTPVPQPQAQSQSRSKPPESVARDLPVPPPSPLPSSNSSPSTARPPLPGGLGEPRRKPTADIAPDLGSGEVKMVVDSLLQPSDAEAKPVPSRDSSHLDDTAGELLPSLGDLDDLDTLGAPPLSSSPVASKSASAAPRKEAAKGQAASAPRSIAQLDRMPAPRPSPSALPAAGFGIRLVATLLDGMVVLVVAGVISLLVGGPWLAEGGVAFFSVILGLSFVLHVFGWNLWGTTPAKRLFGLYVCPVGGSPGISVGAAVLRFLGYGVSAFSLGLGFLMVAFTPGRRGLHDVISGTYVGRWQR